MPMVERCKSIPWLGTNTITIHGPTTVKTIPITKKLGAQTKRPKVLVCYDFHSRILDEKEDVMFVTKLDLFSIGTIKVSTHIKLVSKPIHTPNLNTTYPIPKKIVESVCVLIINLVIPPNIIKQHLPKTFFHQKVGKMIVDETLVQEWLQDLTILGCRVIKEEQLTKINLGTKENV